MLSTVFRSDQQKDGKNSIDTNVVENDPKEQSFVEIPSVAVRWTAMNNITSNVELATLSNVCRQWRRTISQCILEEYDENEDNIAKNNNDESFHPIDVQNEIRQSGEQNLFSNSSNPSKLRSLLLPSMVRELRLQQFPPKNRLQTLNSIDETYCVAWFHPEGIESIQLPREADGESDTDNDTIRNSSSDRYVASPTPLKVEDHRMEAEENAFIPVDDPSRLNADDGRTGPSDCYGNIKKSHGYRSPCPSAGEIGNVASSYQNVQTYSSPRSSKPLSPQKELVSCVYQWSGYCDAVDVLRPFGYSPHFIRSLLDASTKSENLSSKDVEEAKEVDEVDINQKLYLRNFSRCSTSSLSGADCPELPCFPPCRTFAVRGATYARPEGYCLCWDHDDILGSLFFSQRSEDSKAFVKRQEWNEITQRRSLRRRELQREVLPVVLWNEVETDSTSIIRDRNPSTSVQQHAFHARGIRQPCVQFLNIDSSHATRMFTPAFENPISTPVTVFCVAIATEDGCFFSGHRHSFELGHMYPTNTKESLTERSPVILCADYKGPFTNLFERVAESGIGSQHGHANDTSRHRDTSSSRKPPLGYPTIENGFFNSDDSSCDVSCMGSRAGDPIWKCQCPFNGLEDLGSGEPNNSSQESDDENVGKGDIFRGRLGPGKWHCYTAIFDGQNSRIRIDGIEEPLLCGYPIPRTSQAFLDGLTIGADHTFDMSLCFGQGSDGEGEGALAELAVFKGVLDQADVETLEMHLMRKHGILRPQGTPEQIHVEDEMIRLAQYAIAQDISTTGEPLKDGELPRIPLRYLSRLRQVSWKPISPVTGAPMMVHRIGSGRAGLESSDW
ncbi:hypothetical protein IV203_036074 [Nitzschia inconspicua]|uniref:Uncharacterized protein n=1 Tax=Nitzschia inconspicua TaxID=303405 RepID=A0A9K3PXQ0_9STRA|nr:hypothetical protein IV203_036074 [Nitzschia inconspicua]